MAGIQTASAVTVFLVLLAPAAFPQEGKDLPPVKKILDEQAKAWNNGDIEKFMDHYWKSDKLTFSAGGRTTRGWQATLENYKKRYPTREAMGKLRFDSLEIMPLGESAALVLGRWYLDRGDDSMEGNFSLIFHKIGGRWLIVHDHTSRLSK